MAVFMISLIKTSFLMSFVILGFVFINVFLSAKYHAKWRYYIWLIIIMGLIVPFKPDIGLNLPQIHMPVLTDIQNLNSTELESATHKAITNLADMNWIGAPTQTLTQSAPARMPFETILFVIWLSVASFIFTYHVIQYRRFISAIRRWSVDVTDDKTRQIFNLTFEDLKIKSRKPELKTCQFVASPMMMGFIKPIVLLPETPIAQDELELIFHHELIHYRRKDLWVKGLVLFAHVIHWFNPFVYLMANQVQSDCEASCDETVLSITEGDNRKLYGEAIIGILGKRSSFQTIFSTNFNGGKRDMKKRLNSIMNNGKKHTIFAIGCAILIATATIASGTIFVEAKSLASSASEITSERAIELALAKTSGGTIVKCELDYENGRQVYEIEIINGDVKYDMDVAAADGKIYNFKQRNIKTSSANGKNNISISGSEITAEKAKEIALVKTNGGTVKKCELDYENGIKIYEIDIKNGDTSYDMDVSAIDGTIRDFEEKTIASKPQQTSVPTATATQITAEKAKETALAKTGGGVIIKCKLDYDDGRQVYEIEIQKGTTEYDIDIDATSGKIIEFDMDYDD